jgi:hypothetical protein
MKVMTSIRLACAMSLMSLFFMSSISCKKENTTSGSPIVGSWLLYQGADDDNNDEKIDESEWRLFTKDDYDLFKSMGFTGETVFEGDGTGYLVTTTGGKDPFKWSTKADGTFKFEDTGTTSSIFTTNPNSTQKLYIDSNGDLREDVVSNVTSLGIVTIVPTGLKFKRN